MVGQVIKFGIWAIMVCSVVNSEGMLERSDVNTLRKTVDEILDCVEKKDRGACFSVIANFQRSNKNFHRMDRNFADDMYPRTLRMLLRPDESLSKILMSEQEFKSCCSDENTENVFSSLVNLMDVEGFWGTYWLYFPEELREYIGECCQGHKVTSDQWINHVIGIEKAFMRVSEDLAELLIRVDDEQLQEVASAWTMFSAGPRSLTSEQGDFLDWKDRISMYCYSVIDHLSNILLRMAFARSLTKRTSDEWSQETFDMFRTLQNMVLTGKLVLEWQNNNPQIEECTTKIYSELILAGEDAIKDIREDLQKLISEMLEHFSEKDKSEWTEKCVEIFQKYCPEVKDLELKDILQF